MLNFSVLKFWSVVNCLWIRLALCRLVYKLRKQLFKGPDSKQFRLAGRSSYVVTAQLCCFMSKRVSVKRYLRKQAANCGLYFANPQVRVALACGLVKLYCSGVSLLRCSLRMPLVLTQVSSLWLVEA